MKIVRTLAVLFLASILCTAAIAQISAGLRGRVFDATGAAIAGAHVDLTEAATGVRQQTLTSASGDYLFSNLNPGLYSLDVYVNGFQHLQRSGITVIVGQTVGADLTLTTGGERQTITVESDAAGDAAFELQPVVCREAVSGSWIYGDCTLDPASTFQGALVDPNQWEAAPPCP